MTDDSTDRMDDREGRRLASRAALRLEALSIAWMIVEASVSIGAGITARSLLLTAFGVESIIELISAIVLWTRLRLQAAGGGLPAVQRREEHAAKIAGWLLAGLAAYVGVASVVGLERRTVADFSCGGVIVTATAAFGMPILAKAKLRLADRLGSRALRADAMESLTCGYLSWMVLAGLVANGVLHLWWLDSVASMAIVPVLSKEAREALTGACAC